MSSSASAVEVRGREVTSPVAGSPKLPLSTVLLYGLPSISLGFMGALISMYLLKYSTDVLLIAPGVIGLIFGLSRVWDAVSDPLAGYWSDRTRTRFGRRRPWMFAACVPLGLIFIALWSPPASLSGNALTVWIGAGVVLFFTAQTALGIPHLALGAELTTDYHGRSRVFGARQLLEYIGIFAAAGAISLLEPATDERAVARSIAIVGGVSGVFLALLTSSLIRERPEFMTRGPERPHAAFSDVLRNNHARLLVAVFFLDQLGFTCLITIVPYTVHYILGGDSMTGILIGSAIAAALVFFPIWFPLSHRFGKRNPWIVANLVKAAGFGLIFFAEPDAWIVIISSVVLIGSSQGAGGILGPSIKADVIDYDELMTGQRKEGAYFATWNLASKSAIGAAVILVGFVLQASGFEPNVEQSESTLSTIRWLSGGLPLIFSLSAAFLLMRFRLNATEHERIRAALDRRESRLKD